MIKPTIKIGRDFEELKKILAILGTPHKRVIEIGRADESFDRR
jgi:hypothetical protein